MVTPCNQFFSQFGELPIASAILITPPLIYSTLFFPFILFSPFFLYTYVKGSYRVMLCLAKNVLFTSRSIFRAISQLFNATSSDLCWIASSAARSTSPSQVERFGSFFRTVSAYIFSLCNTSKWGVMEDYICINLAFIVVSSTIRIANSCRV